MRIAMLALVAMACSSPGGVSPQPGGGSSGAFEGRLRVFVVDEAGAPIAGASVTVDDAALGETGEDGRLDAELTAYDVVQVDAAGFRSERWLGADAAVLTVPLAARAPRAIQTARVRATLEGWETLTPSPGRELHALLGRARDKALDHPDNAIVGVDDRLRCVAPRDATCELEITVPAGATTLFAELIEVDPADGSETPVGFALGDALTLEADEVREGARLTPLPASALAPIELTLPDPSGAGLDAVVGVPGLGLTDRVLVLTPRRGARTFLLPALDGPLAAASTWAIANGAGADASSRVAVRAAAGVRTDRFELPGLLPPPVLDGATAQRPAGAGLLEVRSDELRILVLDARASVDVDPSRAWTAIATEVEPEVDSIGWSLTRVERAWTRRSTARRAP